MLLKTEFPLVDVSSQGLLLKNVVVRLQLDPVPGLRHLLLHHQHLFFEGVYLLRNKDLFYILLLVDLRLSHLLLVQ